MLESDEESLGKTLEVLLEELFVASSTLLKILPQPTVLVAISTAKSAERILDVFGSNDKIERIYINFCNPWPKSKHNKRRLTHPRQLENYKQFLKQLFYTKLNAGMILC